MRLAIVALVGLSLGPSLLHAQDAPPPAPRLPILSPEDSATAKVDNGALKLTPILAPGYTPEMGFLIAGAERMLAAMRSAS